MSALSAAADRAGAWSPELYRPGRPGVTAGELSLALAGLTLVAALLMGSHVLHGGLYTDDWPIAAVYHFHGAGEVTRVIFLGDHSRPLAAVYLGLVHGISAGSTHVQAGIGLALHVLACWAILWLLRVLGFGRLVAAALALLLLLYPFADSTWLWLAVNQSRLSLLLGALGLLALVHALQSAGARRVVAQAGAALLVATSVLSYETAVAVLVVAAVAISFRYARGRVALIGALPTVLAVVLAAAVPRLPGLLPGVEPHQSIGLGAQIKHAEKIASQSMTVLANSAVPFGAAHRNVVIPILGLIVIVSLVGWRRALAGPGPGPTLRYGLLWVAAGLVVLALAYVVFINTTPGFYEPAAPGSENRINAVAAIGYCAIVIGVAMLVSALMSWTWRPRAAPVVWLVLALVVAIGYAQRIRRDVRAWDRATAIQHAELAELSRALPRPAPRTTLYTFGGVGVTTPTVYAFRVTWDLNGAVQLLWGDRSLDAYPIFTGTTFVCGRTSMYPAGFANGDGPLQRAAYGHILFFDFRTGRRARVGSPGQCRQQAAAFVPATIYPPG